jgi:hypothetical protein
MAHEIMENDFMFSGRGIEPWHGIGSVLDDVLTSDDAIREAKLGWQVNQSPVYTVDNWAVPIPGYMANVREDTKEVLGIVGDKYCVAQNRDVFAFADDLIGTNEANCMRPPVLSLTAGAYSCWSICPKAGLWKTSISPTFAFPMPMTEVPHYRFSLAE